MSMFVCVFVLFVVSTCSLYLLCVCVHYLWCFFFKLKTAADSHAHFPTEQSPAFFRHLQHLGWL